MLQKFEGTKFKNCIFRQNNITIKNAFTQVIKHPLNMRKFSNNHKNPAQKPTETSRQSLN